MGKLSWDVYYRKYWDMTNEEQIKYSNSLANYGDPDEVYEVLMWFCLDDEEHAKKFLKRVYDAGIRFTAEQVCECADIADSDLINDMVLNSTTKFSKDDLINIIFYITGDTLFNILKDADESIYKDEDFIFEMIEEIVYDDEIKAKELIELAISKNCYFKPDHIIQLIGYVDKMTLSLMADNTNHFFTKEELDEVFMEIDDSIFRTICKRANIDYLGDENVDKEYCFSEEHDEEQLKGPGFFTSVLLAIGAASLVGSRKKKRVCDGDCANCPPHYGYRYGRWYYGHSHVHGCELGGNKGDGGRD